MEAQEFQLICQDGRELDLAISAAPLFDADRMVRGGIAALVDITERKRRQRELSVRATQQAFMAELGFYALSQDVDSLIRRVVEAVTEILGVEFADVLELGAEGDNLRLKAGKGWWKGLGNRAMVPADRGSQAGFTLQSHGPVVMDDLKEETRFHGAALFAEHGVVSGMTVIIRGVGGPYGVLGVYSTRKRKFTEDDVHFLQAVANLISDARIREELTRRQIALAETEEKLQRSEHLVSLGTLAAGIAHEINNPLNAVLVNAEYGLLALDREDRELLVRSLQAIEDEAKRCAVITSNVLKLARAEGVPKRLHDVNAVIRQGAELVASYAKLAGAELELFLDGNLPMVKLDPITMEHTVVNLLRNAVEAGGRGVRIQVRSEPAPEGVRLTVTDNGPGVPTGDRNRIFDPFFTTRREQGGTGLGLSVAYRTVVDHGGSIEARETPGGGATFVIELPVPESHDESSPDR
jgi:signal transduction histidine kinase